MPVGNRFCFDLPTLRLASPVRVGSFKNAKLADGQFVDLKGAEPRAANGQTPNDQAPYRKRADRHSSNRSRARRKRQQSCGGRSSLPPCYFARHE
jgi:hypothetical protein